MKRFIASAIASIALVGAAIAADVKSGPGPGKAVPAFTVRDVTGPNRGKSLCYRCAYENRPVACVFVREITDEVAALVQRLDATVGDNQSKDMKAFVVFLTDDAESGAKRLAELAEAKGVKNAPLTLYDDPSGPLGYKLSKNAAVTVLMWKKAKVVVNHAFSSAKLTADEIKAIVGDTSKILE